MIEIDARHEPYEVADLDTGTLLGLVAEDRVRELKGVRRKLRLAYHLAVTNPPAPGRRAAVMGDLAFVAADCEDPLAGEGTPEVALFAVEDYSAAAGLSRPAALSLVADALDLHHRLPKLWERVEALEVEGWKARRIALLTRKLSYEAARWFDTQLAAGGRMGWPSVEKHLAAVIARFHPDVVVRDPQAPVGKEAWGVVLRHPNRGREEGALGVGGTSELTAVGDSLDLARFYDLLTAEADRMRREGDCDTLEQRRAKAIGRLADDTPGAGSDGSTQPGLDLLGATGTARHTGRNDDPAERPGKRRGLRVIVQVGLSDLLGLDLSPMGSDLTGAGESGVAGGPGLAATDRLGPVVVAQLQDWLARHGSIATLTPVIDLSRRDAVDRHDPPEWMATQVRLRDPHCVYPHCDRPSWDCDLDHIDAYQSPDNGGPPGQTHPDNLAPLCRRHHLVKTAGRWRYRRNPDGTYLWTNHHGRTYLVTPFGTLDITETT